MSEPALQSIPSGQGAEANTQPNTSKNKRKRHQKDRATTFRETKSTAFSDERTRSKMAGLGVGPNGIRSKLFSGVSNASGEMGHLGSISVHEPIPISVTSRGIGFATCAFSRALAGYRGFDTPTVHSLYRAFLGIFEAKMRQSKINFPAVNPLFHDCRDFHHSTDWITVQHM